MAFLISRGFVDRHRAYCSMFNSLVLIQLLRVRKCESNSSNTSFFSKFTFLVVSVRLHVHFTVRAFHSVVVNRVCSISSFLTCLHAGEKAHHGIFHRTAERSGHIALMTGDRGRSYITCAELVVSAHWTVHLLHFPASLSLFPSLPLSVLLSSPLFTLTGLEAPTAPPWIPARPAGLRRRRKERRRK